MRGLRAQGWLLATLALALHPGASARAFGGLWSSDGEARVTAVKLLVVDHPGPAVTVVAQLEHVGRADKLAWILPARGTPGIALSSGVVLERLVKATAPEHWVEVDATGCELDAEAGDARALDAGVGLDLGVSPSATAQASIAVRDRAVTGDYDAVAITADEDPADKASAVVGWLTKNGYFTTGSERELLAPYLDAGYDFVAVELASAGDPSATRPLAITFDAERPALALRPLSLAASNRLAITVFVVGPAQAVPIHYDALILNDALIDWLSGKTFALGTLPFGGAGPFGGSVPVPESYADVLHGATREADGHGFASELGTPASQLREWVFSELDEETRVDVLGGSYPDGLAAVARAGAFYLGWDGFVEAVEAASVLPDGVSAAELARDPESFRGQATVETARFLEGLDAQVIGPVAEAGRLLHEGPYLTRLSTVMRAQDLSRDPELDFNPELAQIGNVRIAKQSLDCGEHRAARAPYAIELPQGGLVRGQGGEPWPHALGSMPASLKIVRMSTRGSGKVIADHSRAIGQALQKASSTVAAGTAIPHGPAHGLLIGGTQTVSYAGESSSGGGCSITHAQSARAQVTLAWVLLTGVLLACRRKPATTDTAPRRPVPTLSARASLWKLALVLALLTACSEDGSDAFPMSDASTGVPTQALSPEELRDPETCRSCHPIHFREWSGSMHAYSARDPVFLAMNRRGQRETNGALGDFCIKCHAPMAVVDKLTPDGLDLPDLPDFERGVSCYFCHNVVAIEGDHNAMLRLGNDRIMRGPISDPVPTRAHGAMYAEHFDEALFESSKMCGACHDIVTPNGVRLERTFEEYQAGLFSKSATGEPMPFETCSGCHMPGREAYAAVPSEGGRLRQVHEHFWPGVDVPLDPFPHSEAMRSAVEDCQLGLGVSFFTLEVTPPDLFTFQLESAAGHNTPSGAAQDRRMWIEFSAYDDEGNLLPGSSGQIADDEIEEHPEGHPEHDPQLAMFRDHIYDAAGKPVHMFWEAAKSIAHPEGFSSSLLPVATTTYVEGKHAVIKQFRASSPNGLHARIAARLRIRPIGLDVLNDLVESGDLDPAIAARMPTFTFGAQIEWKREDGTHKTIAALPQTDCESYRCMLDPTAPGCS